MKDAFVTVHGHFYQPPRENPWTEFLEREESASPFHDWNERITAECYRPNGAARIVDAGGRIMEIVNNYASMNFNFGPTLLVWLEKHAPAVYRKIIEGDREGRRRFGHGNAIGQTFNHVILPLANDRDKETEVVWGIRDFEYRFDRRPEALWLPETAVNLATLEVLARHGMAFALLSPFQARRVRPLGAKAWTDVTGGRIDSTQAYRCRLQKGKGSGSSSFIDLFFYDGPLSKEISFEGLLGDGAAFCRRLARAYDPSRKRPQLIHVATDGETYGHHKKFGEMALAHVLRRGLSLEGLELTSYAAFLKRFPPAFEVEIDEGPKGEGSAWSCAHGVGRWKEDCGCSTGGQPGWNQRWRTPLREGLNLLRDELARVFEEEGSALLKDVWAARNDYVEVVLDRSPAGRERFFGRHGAGPLGEKERIRAIKLLEMERHSLQMFTSCGWFFCDLSGLETVLLLQHAHRAIELAGEVSGRNVEEAFLDVVARAESNVAGAGNGRAIYERLVRPRAVTAEKVVNHFAMAACLGNETKEKTLLSCRVRSLDAETVERDGLRARLGRASVETDAVPERRTFFYALIPTKSEVFRAWVVEDEEGLVWERVRAALPTGREEMGRQLVSLLGEPRFGLGDSLREEREGLFAALLEKEIGACRRVHADLYDRARPAVEALVREGMTMPPEFRAAAETTLNERFLHAATRLIPGEAEEPFEARIEEILDEARNFRYRLDLEPACRLWEAALTERMNVLDGADHAAMRPAVEEMIRLLTHAERWSLPIRKEEVQDRVFVLLQSWLESLEESWWENGPPRAYPYQIVDLAEKLGLNVERARSLLASLR